MDRFDYKPTHYHGIVFSIKCVHCWGTNQSKITFVLTHLAEYKLWTVLVHLYSWSQMTSSHAEHQTETNTTARIQPQQIVPLWTIPNRIQGRYSEHDTTRGIQRTKNWMVERKVRLVSTELEVGKTAVCLELIYICLSSGIYIYEGSL